VLAIFLSLPSQQEGKKMMHGGNLETTTTIDDILLKCWGVFFIISWIVIWQRLLWTLYNFHLLMVVQVVMEIKLNRSEYPEGNFWFKMGFLKWVSWD
jgi:hypothetical protein